MVKLSNNVFGCVCETIMQTMEDISQTEDELLIYDNLTETEATQIKSTVNLLFKKLISVGQTYIEYMESEEHNNQCLNDIPPELAECHQENKEESICQN